MKVVTQKSSAVAGALLVGVGLLLGLTASPAAATEITVCARNEAGVVAQVEFGYKSNEDVLRAAVAGDPETLLLGQETCRTWNDVSAYYVFMQGWTTQWTDVCNITRTGTRNTKVVLRGTVFNMHCTTE